MIKWFLKWRKQRQFSKLLDSYMKLGASIGDGLSYSYMGEPVGIDKDIRKLAELEERWIKEGNEPFTMDEWVSHGGYNMKLTIKPRTTKLTPAKSWVERFDAGKVKFGTMGAQIMLGDNDNDYVGFIEGETKSHDE